MRPAVAAILYPGCIYFEIALAVETLSEQADIRVFTPSGGDHMASGGLGVKADGSFDDLKHARVGAVLIPGGDPRSILEPENLIKPALVAQAAQGAILAGICAGALVLAASGLLVGRRGTHNYTLEHAPRSHVEAVAGCWRGMTFVRADLVEDGRFITAQPWAYREFAAAVARQLGQITPEQADLLVAYPARKAYGRDA